jgi:uncharacterized damage-inducible protein DinB
MKRSTFASVLVLAGALGAASPAAAQNVRSEILAGIHDARDKLIQLAEATPEDRFAFRPAKDVRSTAEVFMHVVSGNYGVPSFWGVRPPDDFDMDYEKSVTKKADVVKALRDSFAHLENGFAGISDAELEKQRELFGGQVKTSVRGGYLMMLAHAHEHLGQSIAYARMNGVTPPWTAKRQQQAKPAAK